MKNLVSTNVSKIVAHNYRTAQVFTAHGIDFCCNGGIPLEQACQQQRVDVQKVMRDIKDALAVPETEHFATMPLDDLIRHIEKVHHVYVRSTAPALTAYLAKLGIVHGERHPEVFEIEELFGQSAVELVQHMAREEQILFPYVQALAAARRGKFPLSPPHFGHLQNPIKMMESEHKQEDARFKKIAALSNGFTPPKDACQTYRVAFMVLQEFELDLRKHMHLENNILFPNALAMYKNACASAHIKEDT